MAVNLRKHVGKMLVTLLTGGVVLGLQNSNSEAAESSAAQATSGSVEQFFMQMERNWAKAIVEHNVAKIREIVAADVVLTTPSGARATGKAVHSTVSRRDEHPGKGKHKAEHLALQKDQQITADTLGSESFPKHSTAASKETAARRRKH